MRSEAGVRSRAAFGAPAIKISLSLAWRCGTHASSHCHQRCSQRDREKRPSMISGEPLNITQLFAEVFGSDI